MAIRVGRWDCESCGYIGNKGPLTRCEKCGSPRPENVKFYLADDSEIVTKREEIEKAKAGVDWVCSYCGAHNKAYDKNCHSCGVQNKKSEEHKNLQVKETYYDQKKQENQKKQEPKQKSHANKPPKKLPGCFKVGFLILFFGAIGLFILSLFTKEIDVEVVDKKWESVYELEKNEQIEEEAWEVPNGAENVTTFKAVHHYDKKSKGYVTKTRTVKVKVGEEKYVCGQRDLGNGYFEDIYCTRDIYEEREEEYEEEIFEKIPVYKTKYRFNIWKWTKHDDEKFSGTGAFKELDLKQLDKNHGHKHRIEDVETEFFIYVKDHKSEKQEEEVGQNYYNKTNIGDILKAKRSSIFNFYVGLIDDTDD